MSAERGQQAVSCFHVKIDKVDRNIVSGNTLAYSFGLLVTGSHPSEPVVGHFLRNASNSVFGHDAPNFPFQVRNLVDSALCGARTAIRVCPKNEDFARHVKSALSPLDRSPPTTAPPSMVL